MQPVAQLQKSLNYFIECLLYLSTVISDSLSDGVSRPVVLSWLSLPVTLKREPLGSCF